MSITGGRKFHVEATGNPPYQVMGAVADKHNSTLRKGRVYCLFCQAQSLKKNLEPSLALPEPTCVNRQDSSFSDSLPRCFVSASSFSFSGIERPSSRYCFASALRPIIA